MARIVRKEKKSKKETMGDMFMERISLILSLEARN